MFCDSIFSTWTSDGGKKINISHRKKICYLEIELTFGVTFPQSNALLLCISKQDDVDYYNCSLWRQKKKFWAGEEEKRTHLFCMSSTPLILIMSRRYPEFWGRSPPHFSLKSQTFLQFCISNWRIMVLLMLASMALM